MTKVDHMAAIRETFFQECDEQLAALEAGLITMEEGDTSPDTVNAVFRAVHSIKGGAGAFKLHDLVAFAHVFETALDKVRSGILVPDADVLKLMLRAIDVLSDIVSAARDGNAITPRFAQPIIDEFNALMGQDGNAAEEDEYADIDFQPLIVAVDEPSPAFGFAELHVNEFEISFCPKRELYEKANEPQLLFRELQRIGALAITCNIGSIPPIDEIDPQQSYLEWNLILSTSADLAEVTEVFEFVDGDCQLIDYSYSDPGNIN